MARRDSRIGRHSETRGKRARAEFSKWQKIDCCETPAGKLPPKVTIKLGVASKGRSFGIRFTAWHPCGLQNYKVTVTVYDGVGGAWTLQLTDTFDCGPPPKLTLVRRRWVWAIARIGGEPPAEYMGPLPDRITAAEVNANVQSCCGVVADVTERIDTY